MDMELKCIRCRWEDLQLWSSSYLSIAFLEDHTLNLAFFEDHTLNLVPDMFVSAITKAIWVWMVRKFS